MKFIATYLNFVLISVLLMSLSSCNFSPKQTIQLSERTITVTGSAEKEIVPDEIWFYISIKEYYDGANSYDYYYYDNYSAGTKINISEIDLALKDELANSSFDTSRLITDNMGNYYRYYGSEYLKSKQYKIKLDSLTEAEYLLNSINSKGVESMRLGKMEHSEMENIRQEVKKEALNSAKNKAAYLVETLDKKLGEVISITEIPNYLESYPYYYAYDYDLSSNASLPMDGGTVNTKTIKIRYEMQVVFGIE
jgi:uncharacterized protein